MNKTHVMNFSVMGVMLMTFAISAEISLGISLSTYLKRDVKEKQVQQGEEHERTTTYGLDIFPSLCIVPSGKTEIVPIIGISFLKKKTVEEDEEGKEKDKREETEFGVGAGCGLFFRLIEGTAFRLSLGPDVFVWFYDPDNAVDVSLGLPVNVDFLLSERWFLRLNSRLVAIGYEYQKERGDEHTNSFTFFDIESMLEASLGFFFTF